MRFNVFLFLRFLNLQIKVDDQFQLKLHTAKQASFFDVWTVVVTSRVYFSGRQSPQPLSVTLNFLIAATNVHKIITSLQAKHSVYTSIGCHTFSYAAPQIWNAIPLNIRISPWVSSLKHNLTTYYFAAAF